MKTLSKTQVQKAQEEMRNQMNLVMRKCKVSDLTYCEFQYELGVSFCKSNLIEDQFSEKILKEQSYWKWFKNEWREFEGLLIHYFNVQKVQSNKDTFYWESYCSKMERIKYCQRAYLSFKHYLSIQSKGL